MYKLLEKMPNPLIIILIAALARLLPHPPNFAPIAAMALFGGTYMDKKYAIALPLTALFVSDLFIGFYDLGTQLAVYGSFVLAGLIGIWLKSHKTVSNIISGAFLSSILFFVITNFSVWAFGTLYPKDLGGLLQSYTLALPFFRNTILGDIFYAGVFFGGFELVKAWSTRMQKATA
jgi:hypothetical protein